jgi:hypothetical protein
MKPMGTRSVDSASIRQIDERSMSSITGGALPLPEGVALRPTATQEFAAKFRVYKTPTGWNWDGFPGAVSHFFGSGM